MVYNIPRGVLSFLGLSVLQPGCTLGSPEEPVKLSPAWSSDPQTLWGWGPSSSTHREGSGPPGWESMETAQASHKRAQETTRPENSSQRGCRGAAIGVSGGFPRTQGRCQRPKQRSNLHLCASQSHSQFLLSLATENTFDKLSPPKAQKPTRNQQASSPWGFPCTTRTAAPPPAHPVAPAATCIPTRHSRARVASWLKPPSFASFPSPLGGS